MAREASRRSRRGPWVGAVHAGGQVARRHPVQGQAIPPGADALHQLAVQAGWRTGERSNQGPRAGEHPNRAGRE
jgi:hypothetical protein